MIKWRGLEAQVQTSLPLFLSPFLSHSASNTFPISSTRDASKGLHDLFDNPSRGPTSLGTWMLREGLWWVKSIWRFLCFWTQTINAFIFHLLLFFRFFFFLHALPHFLHSLLLCVTSCCICSDFTCMWPLHIPVNNHTLQHGYWSVTVNPARSFSPINWLSRTSWTNRKGGVWVDQSVYGQSKKKKRRGTASSSAPATTTPTPPNLWPPPTPSQQVNICPLTCACVFGSMAVMAPGRRRTSSGSSTPSRLSSGTCTGPRRSSPSTSRAASSSCRATWSRTVWSGAYLCDSAWHDDRLPETQKLQIQGRKKKRSLHNEHLHRIRTVECV